MSKSTNGEEGRGGGSTLDFFLLNHFQGIKWLLRGPVFKLQMVTDKACQVITKNVLYIYLLKFNKYRAAYVRISLQLIFSCCLVQNTIL